MYLKVNQTVLPQRSLYSIALAVHLRKIIFLAIKLILYTFRYFSQEKTAGHLRKILFLAVKLYIYLGICIRYILSGTLCKKKQTSR